MPSVRDKQEFQDYKNTIGDFGNNFKDALRDSLVLMRGIQEGFIDINNKSKWIQLLTKLKKNGFDDFKKMGDHLFEAAGATDKLKTYYDELNALSETNLRTIAESSDATRDLYKKIKEVYKVKEDTVEVDEEQVENDEERNELADDLIEKMGKLADKAKKNLQMSSLLESSFTNISNQLNVSTKLASDMGQLLNIDPFESMTGAMQQADEILQNLGNSQFKVDDKTLNFQDAVKATDTMFENARKVKNELLDIRSKSILDTLEIELNFDKAAVQKELKSMFPDKTEVEVGLQTDRLMQDKTKMIDSIINSFAGLEVLSPDQIEQADYLFKFLSDNNKDQIKALLLQEGEIRRRNNLEERRTAIQQEQLKIMSQFKPVFNSLEESGQQLAFAVDRTFNQLPNWLGQILGTQKVTDAISQNMQKSLNESVELLASGVSPMEAISSFGKSFAGGMKSALTPFGLILAAVAIISVLLVGIEGTVKEISTELGVSRAEAKKIYANSLELEQSYSNQFATQVRIREILKSHKDLYGTILDLTDETNRETIRFASTISSAYGVAAGEVYGLVSQLQTIGADKTLSENLVAWLATASDLSNISFDVITKDLTEASDVVATYFAGYPKQAAKAAIQVRRMGMSLKQAGQIMEKSLDVSGFLTDMTELASMTGGLADLSGVFEMRFSGESPEKIAAAVVEQFDSLPDAMQKNQFIAKKFADTIGLSVDELRKGQQIRKLSASLSKDELSTLNAHLNSLTEADLANGRSAAAKANELSSTERLGVAFSKIQATLTRAFLPIIETIANTLSESTSFVDTIGIGFKVIGSIIQFLAPIVEGFFLPFKLIAQAVRWILDTVDGWLKPFGLAKKSTDDIGFGMKAIKMALTGIGVLMGANFISKLLIGKKILGSIPGLLGKIPELGSKLFGGLLGKIPGLSKVKTSLSNQGGMLGKVFGDKVTDTIAETTTDGLDKITDPLEKVGGKSTSIFEKVGSGIKKILTGIVDFITTTVSKVSAAVGDVFKNILGGIGDGLSKFGPKALQGAAALLVISGALWVTSKAMQNFNDVEWDSVWKGLTALTALTLAAVVLGNVAGQVIMGAAALAIMGAALIPTAIALKMFGDVEWSSLAKAGVALVGLSTAVIALGAIMMSGVGAAAILLGVTALSLMGAALIPAAIGMKMFGSAFKIFEEVDWNKLKGAVPIILAISASALGIVLAAPGLLIASTAIAAFSGALLILGMASNSVGDLKGKIGDPLAQIQNINAGNFGKISGGLISLAYGLAALSVGNLLTGFTSFFSGDPVKKLERLANLASPMSILSDSIQSLSIGLGQLFSSLKQLESIDLSSLKTLSMGSAAVKLISNISSSNIKESNITASNSMNMSSLHNRSTNVASHVDGSESIESVNKVIERDLLQPQTTVSEYPTNNKIDQTRIVNAINNLTQIMMMFANRPVYAVLPDSQISGLNNKIKRYNNR